MWLHLDGDCVTSGSETPCFEDPVISQYAHWTVPIQYVATKKQCRTPFKTACLWPEGEYPSIFYRI